MEYCNITDEELTLLAKTDEFACETLILRYKNLVISLSRKYYLQGGTLEDLISEGMIGLYRAITCYNKDNTASFSTYAYICVSRQLQNTIKKSLTKNNSLLNSYSSIYDHENLSGGANPEELFLYREGEAKLLGQLRKILSQFEFDVLEQYILGLSYSEIAQKFQINDKKVDNALTRARKKIQEMFNQ